MKIVITEEEIELRRTLALGLSQQQIESLRQYANECKMRPGQFPDDWRDVPTSDGEFRYAANGAYWLQIANTF